MTTTIQQIDLDDIYADESFNCRGTINPLDVNELMMSIKQQGLIQPISVQPYNEHGKKYRVLCGHRRFTAFYFLASAPGGDAFKKIAAIVHENLSVDDATFINFTENLNRKDLTIGQEAETIKNLLAKGFTYQEIAKKVGKSYGWVQVRVDLLTLPTDVQREANIGVYTQDQIKSLASINRRLSEDELYAACRKLKDAKIQKKEIKLAAVPEEKKEKPVIVPKGKPRRPEEITALQDCIRSNVDNNILTRLLAWTLHYVTTAEIISEISVEYPLTNVPESLSASEF